MTLAGGPHAPGKPGIGATQHASEARFDRLIRLIRNLSLFVKLQKPDRLHLISRGEIIELYSIFVG